MKREFNISEDQKTDDFEENDDEKDIILKERSTYNVYSLRRPLPELMEAGAR